MSFKDEALVIGDGFLGNSFKEAGFEVISSQKFSSSKLEGKRYFINTVALTDIDQCEQFPKKARQCNIDIAESCASWGRAYGVKLIHVSTAHVYGAQNKRVNEESPCRAQSIYGLSKYFADELIKDSALILRGNLFYSEFDHPKNLFNKLKGYNKFTIEAQSVTCCETIVSAAEELKDEVGIFNIADDVKSMWSIAQIMGLAGQPVYSDALLGDKKYLHPNVVMDCKRQFKSNPVQKIFEKFALNRAGNV